MKPHFNLLWILLINPSYINGYSQIRWAIKCWNADQFLILFKQNCFSKILIFFFRSKICLTNSLIIFCNFMCFLFVCVCCIFLKKYLQFICFQFPSSSRTFFDLELKTIFYKLCKSLFMHDYSIAFYHVSVLHWSASTLHFSSDYAWKTHFMFSHVFTRIK